MRPASAVLLLPPFRQHAGRIGGGTSIVPLASAKATVAAMPLPFPLSTKPMEAEPIDALPGGTGWLYEPKYDGFRCLAFRDGDRIDLHRRTRSRSAASSRRSSPVSLG